jgi:urease accessory protein
LTAHPPHEADELSGQPAPEATGSLNLSDPLSLLQLLAWTSPAYPTGAFSYSHGLEWAVEAGRVSDLATLVEYVLAVLSRGGGWTDAVLFVQVWRAASDPDALDELAELAGALRGSAETALESTQQGRAFLEVSQNAWPHPALEAFSVRHSGKPIAHCVAVALTCAVHGIDLVPGLLAYLSAVAANLVSAGARLIPLGQTQAQIAITRLSPRILEIGERARLCPLEDLGTAAPAVELCSMLHETQYTRLFRS